MLCAFIFICILDERFRFVLSTSVPAMFSYVPPPVINDGTHFLPYYCYFVISERNIGGGIFSYSPWNCLRFVLCSRCSEGVEAQHRVG